MSIETTILEQLKRNDPDLTELDLSYQKLDDQDIQSLVEALADNTTLTALNVSGNKIRSEGVKALASNTTLTALNVGYNQIGVEGATALASNTTLIYLDLTNNEIGNEGAKVLASNTMLIYLNLTNNKVGDEGAKALAMNTTLACLSVKHNQIGAEGTKALASNTTLASLEMAYNQIGTEGAKALATNPALTFLKLHAEKWYADQIIHPEELACKTTLPALNVGYNPFGDNDKTLNNLERALFKMEYNKFSYKEKQALAQALERNKQQQMLTRRNSFIKALILLAYDYDKDNSQKKSYWSSLPKELMLHVISLMNFRPHESIGKSAQQIQACATFIFDNTPELKASLAESYKAKQVLKIVEKNVNGKSHFHFFSSPPAKAPDKAETQEENTETYDELELVYMQLIKKQQYIL